MRRSLSDRHVVTFAVLVATAMALIVTNVAYMASATAGAEPSDRLREPVVLLHGWHGAGAGGVERTGLSVLARRLADDGHPVYWASGVGADRTDTVYDSAEHLGQIVSDVSARHERSGVAVIAHSYGGIVARALVESDLYTPVLRRGARVTSIVTLGTPMAGVDMWLPFVFLLGDPDSEPSVWELTPAFMNAFNMAHRPNPNVAYTLVAGDARSQSWLLRVLPPSDGVVTVSSAHALCGRCYGLSELVTDDFHAPHSLARRLDWHTYLDADNTYDSVISPALLAGASDGIAATYSGRNRAASAEVPYDASVRTWVHKPIEHGLASDSPTDRITGSLSGAVRRLFPADVGDVTPRTDAVATGPALAAVLDVAPADRESLGLAVRASAGSLHVQVQSVGLGTDGRAIDRKDASTGDAPDGASGGTTGGASGGATGGASGGATGGAEFGANSRTTGGEKGGATNSAEIGVASRAAGGETGGAAGGPQDNVWAQLRWRGGSRAVQLISRPSVGPRSTAGAAPDVLTSEAVVGVGPGYYLVRVGAAAKGGPVETETVVVVPYAHDTRPARITDARVHGSTVSADLYIVQSGRYVVSVSPPGDVGAPGHGASGAAVRTLPVGRSLVRVALTGDLPAAASSRGGVTGASIRAHYILRVFRAEEGLMLAEEAQILAGRLER